MEDMRYIFRDGRELEDQKQSEIMYKIREIEPETTSIWKSTYEWNEMGMAELFCDCYKENICFCPDNSTWYTYDGHVWRGDSGSLLCHEKLKEFVRLMNLYATDIEDEDLRELFLKFVTKMGDRRYRERILKDAESLIPVRLEKFDADPYLINFRNGTYDMRTFTFRHHKCDDYLTMSTSCDYTRQKGIRCKRWETFIDEITQGDKSKADYIQRALGYSLLGMSNEECMFILYGKTTRNGKSTLLNTIQYLLGDYSTVAPVGIICTSRGHQDSGAANPVMVSLKGKRFVTMSESNQYGKLDEEIIKQMTGGEQITARALYSAPITFTPQFTLWLSCNDLPTVNDKSLFASDRLNVIEFNRHFTKEEQDKNLKAEFEKPKNMIGVFNWLIEGYKKYLLDGLRMPDEMHEVVNEYKEANDVILMFLSDNCEKNPDLKIKCKGLYDTYKVWAKSNGFYVMSIQRFTKEMDSQTDWYDSIIKPKNVKWYVGLTMKGATV